LFTLTGGTTRRTQEKSRLAAGLSCSRQLRTGLAALIGILTLTVRVLLLLAGLLAAALLLPGLLTRVLMLLARLVLIVLVRHFGISLVERNGR
jgi:hypothetical protein